MPTSHHPPLIALCPCPDCPACLVLDANEPLDAARPCPDGLAARLEHGKECVSALARHAGLAAPPRLLRIDEDADPLLRQLGSREGALPIGSLSGSLPDEAVLRLSTIGRMNEIAAADRCRAFIAGLFSLPGTAERSLRHGLTLLWLDERRIYAALVFRNAVHALAELSFPVLFGPGRENGAGPLVRLLDDFRLGWLPDEEAARHGGVVWRAGDLPDEAEGFKPLMAAGPEADALAGRARITADAPGRILCLGLLHCARIRGGQPDAAAR